MKPTVRKVKDIRGRRIVGYKATIGGIDGSGNTPAEAIAHCESTALAALERLDRGTLVGSWRDHVYVISPTTNGWSYWIDTFSSDGYHVSLGNADRESALDAALCHLAQHLWEIDVDDASFLTNLPKGVVAELSQWIRFQRSYAALRAEGKSDVEAHRLAAV